MTIFRIFSLAERIILRLLDKVRTRMKSKENIICDILYNRKPLDPHGNSSKISMMKVRNAIFLLFLVLYSINLEMLKCTL